MQPTVQIVAHLFCALLLLQSGIVSAFNFPAAGENGAANDFMAGADPGLSRQAITPAIVTPGNTCICVPTGQCNFGSVPGNTDGTGLIDIRIVNSVRFNSGSRSD